MFFQPGRKRAILCLEAHDNKNPRIKENDGTCLNDLKIGTGKFFETRNSLVMSELLYFFSLVPFMTSQAPKRGQNSPLNT